MFSFDLMKTRKQLLNTCIAGVIGFTSTVSVAATSGELYVTRYAGLPNVGKFEYNYDGVDFSVANINWFASTSGADGIIGNPQAPGELLIGGQGYSSINGLNPLTGEVVVYDAPINIFHLVATDSKTVFGSGLPSETVKFNISANGSLDAGVIVPLTGEDTEITQLIPTPRGYYYNADIHGGGNGVFGRIDFNHNLTAGTTTRLASGLLAAHGGTYDPYTDTIIIFGGRHIYQMDFEGNIISDLQVPAPPGEGEHHFDQGTVDGKGHIFVASNLGFLVFVDISQTKLVAHVDSFVDMEFISDFLDDVAPLIGYGSTDVDLTYNGCNNGFGNGTDCEPYGHVDNTTANNQEQDDYSAGGWVDDQDDNFRPTNYYSWWGVHTHNSWGTFGSSKQCPNWTSLGSYSSGAWGQFVNLLRDRNTLKSGCMQKGAANKWGNQFNIWYGAVRLQADNIDHIIYHAPHANGVPGNGAALGWTIVDASNQTVIASGHLDYTDGNPHKIMPMPQNIETSNGIDIWMGFVGNVGAKVFHDTTHNKNQWWLDWLAEKGATTGEVVGATGKNVIGVTEFTFMQRIQ